jgi:hypothetical protein
MDNGEKKLMAALASVNARIAGFVGGTLPDEDGVRLGRDLTVLGHALRRQARLRTVRWGQAYLEPGLGHVRTTGRGRPIASTINGAVVGPALCGAWLVDDLPVTGFAACSVCLAVLARE